MSHDLLIHAQPADWKHSRMSASLASEQLHCWILNKQQMDRAVPAETLWRVTASAWCAFLLLAALVIPPRSPQPRVNSSSCLKELVSHLPVLLLWLGSGIWDGHHHPAVKTQSSPPRAGSERYRDALQALPSPWTPAGAEESQDKFLSCSCTRSSCALSLAPKPCQSPVAVHMGKTLPRHKEGQDEGLPTPKEFLWTQIAIF